MNKFDFSILRSFLFVFLWLSSVNSFSQTGTAVTMTVQNVVQTAPTIFEYDIMLQNTGTTTLALQGYTFGMNHAAGMNGTGTITHAYVSRDVLLAALNPPTPAYTASSNHLRLATSNTSAANAVPLPSGVSMRIATMRVSNTVSFPAGFNPSLTMQTILATGKTQCTATCIVTPPGSSYALNGLSNTPSAGSLQALNGVVTAPCFFLNPTAPFAVSVNATTPAICYGQSSGTAQLSLTGNGSALTGSYSDNGAPSIAYSTSPFTVSNLAAGAHTLSVTSLNGCTAAVNVTITQPAVPITSSFSATSCSSYTWNGITYTTSGSYAYTYTNAQGCDSVRTLQLSITNITGSSATSACSSYTWNGITYTTSGSYVRTYTNAQGCDSIHTLFLTIHPLPLVTASNVVRCIGSAVQLQGSPLGGVYSLANPYNGAAASYTYTYTDGYGCSATSLPASVSVTGCDVNLQLHLMIQGYYNSSSTMVPVLMNEGVSSDSTLVDTLIVELHTPTAPYGLVASQQTLLHTDGTASCLFPYFTGSYYIAGSYYVVLRHRNGIETWSAAPVAFSSTNVLYDFANASSKAYDNSMLAMEPGVWALYSGDINQDENIDLFDLIVLEEATNNFLYGYYPSDVNGDGNCDLLDVAYIEPNTFDFVFSAHPAWYGGLPAVSTTAVGSITFTSAVSGGTISSDGGAAVTARGVCWSTSPNPTVSLSTKTVDGIGSGSFSSNITGLVGGTTYYVRAYATNSVGISYGSQVAFTTAQPTYPVGSVFCTGTPTAIVDVTNPVTGKTWMDRNLGAMQSATSSIDANAYGDLYQWGRRADGHQCRTSPTTSTLSSTDLPGHGNFILAPNPNQPYDWRSPQNNNLWQGVNGVNNPCPSGYRLPTETELNAERTSWSSNNSTGAFASPLKLPLAGYRGRADGSLWNVGNDGGYWSSTVSSTNSKVLFFSNLNPNFSTSNRASGFTVRCIKETAGTINSLDCNGATNTGGYLIQGIAASSVSISISYTGGNAGTYSLQTVNSTGVTGLTATLPAGTFANGNGTLVFAISGTPAGAGTASFALSLGGQSCTLNWTVNLPGSITNLSCATATNTGSLTSGTAAIGVSSSISYTGGNGGTYSAQIVNSTAVTGLSASLSAGALANGSGSLVYTITGTPSAAGTASFALSVGGQTCTLNRTVNLPVGSITTLNCANATYLGTCCVQGVAPNGVNCIVSYTGGNGGSYSAQTISSTGVNGLIASLSAGTFANGTGSLNYTITGIADSIGTASFPLFIGGYACSINYYINPSIISSLSCTSATTIGTLTQGTAAIGVNSTIPYTGGNGGAYSSQTVNSTGVTGLTASLSAGSLVNGNGALTYTITGTPTNAGIAVFAISIGGQTCWLQLTVQSNVQPNYPTGSVFCNGIPTLVLDVYDPGTGKIWMDRNLGASQVATSSSDANAYGDSYQWGRRSDGHQCRNLSGSISILSSSDQPTHSNFIVSGSAVDWRSPQNDNLWQGNGINNPCPNSYRLPTFAELEASRSSWSSNNSVGAFASALKYPLAGYRSGVNGTNGNMAYGGYYWSSTISTWQARSLAFGSSFAQVGSSYRNQGNSVRCIKD